MTATLAILWCAAGLLPPAAQTAEPEFRVRYDLPGAAVAPGLGTGINDLGNATSGCWKAYRDNVRPQGGIARLWLKYSISPLRQDHVDAGLEAAKCGMDVMVVCFGAPENLAPGAQGSENRGIPPRDLAEWTAQVARDVTALRDAGVPVKYVEIWNEPDLAEQWFGSREEFVRFFAGAGARLRDALPAEVKLGGPGMASDYGASLRFFGELLAECRRAGFTPDFLSFHFYGSFPTVHLAFDLSGRLHALAQQHGVPEPELILSEWNIVLPRPRAPELDDHRAGVFFIALCSTLAYTGVDHSVFFFLQDGHWEAEHDYQGESVGVFTLRGGPKPVLNGMRMFRTAAALPAVPVERRDAPWNLSVLATRAGDRGYLLVANAFGFPEKLLRYYLDAQGVQLGDYRDDEAKLRAFLEGRLDYAQLGAPREHQEAWESARALLRRCQAEARLTEREVRLELAAAPRRVVRAWRLSQASGVPLQDHEFRLQFAEAARGALTLAGEETLQRLAEEGVAEKDLQVLRGVLEKRDHKEAQQALEQARRQVGEKLVSHAEELFRGAYESRLLETPSRLADLPGARMAEVPPASCLRSAGDELFVALPPFSAVLVEFSWSGSPQRGEGGGR